MASVAYRDHKVDRRVEGHRALPVRGGLRAVVLNVRDHERKEVHDRHEDQDRLRTQRHVLCGRIQAK